MNVSARNTASYLHEERTETHVLFDGLVDAKGRTIGAFVRLTPVTVTAGFEPGGLGYASDLPVGEHVNVYVQVTRDGSRYGATQRGHVCASRELAQRKADELVAAARTRYAKRAAAGEKL